MRSPVGVRRIVVVMVRLLRCGASSALNAPSPDSHEPGLLRAPRGAGGGGQTLSQARSQAARSASSIRSAIRRSVATGIESVSPSKTSTPPKGLAARDGGAVGRLALEVIAARIDARPPGGDLDLAAGKRASSSAVSAVLQMERASSPRWSAASVVSS